MYVHVYTSQNLQIVCCCMHIHIYSMHVHTHVCVMSDEGMETCNLAAYFCLFRIAAIIIFDLTR